MIDESAILKAILGAGTQSVRSGLQMIETRAQELAPVRNVFKSGGRTRKVATFDVVASENLTRSVALQMSGQNARVLRAESFLYHPTRNAAHLDLSDTPESGGRIRARQNSYAPLLHTPGGLFSAEEVRELAPNTHELKFGSSRVFGSLTVNDLLSSRGRYELGHVRGVNKGRFEAGAQMPDTLGGRLKSGIKTVMPEQRGLIVQGFVVSEAVDPSTGHDYTADQEFGTRHNRAHPYMRPATAESRARIVDLQRGTVARELKKVNVGVGSIPVRITLSAVWRVNTRGINADLKRALGGR